MAKAGSDAVVVVVDEGLNGQVKEGAAEPDDGGMFMWDSKELEVRGEKRELERPTERDPATIEQ